MSNNAKFLDMYSIKKTLQKEGFVQIRQRGTHCIYKKGNILLSLPLNTNNAYLIKKLLKRNQIFM